MCGIIICVRAHRSSLAPQEPGATGAWRHVMQSVRACEAMGSRSWRSYGHHGDVIRASKHSMQLCEYMCCGRTTFAADRQARRRQSTDLVVSSSRTCERVTGTCVRILRRKVVVGVSSARRHGHGSKPAQGLDVLQCVRQEAACNRKKITPPHLSGRFLHARTRSVIGWLRPLRLHLRVRAQAQNYNIETGISR